MQTQLTGRFAAALEYARAAHGSQRRKGTDIPYLSHVIAMAALVERDQA